MATFSKNTSAQPVLTMAERRQIAFRKALANLRKLRTRKTIAAAAEQKAIARLERAAKRLTLNAR